MEEGNIAPVPTPNIDLIVSRLSGLADDIRSQIPNTGIETAEFEREVHEFAEDIRCERLSERMGATTMYKLVTWGEKVDANAVLAVARRAYKDFRFPVEGHHIALALTPNIDLIVASVNGLSRRFRSQIPETGLATDAFELEMTALVAAIRSGQLGLIMGAAIMKNLLRWGREVDAHAVLAIGRGLKHGAFNDVLHLKALGMKELAMCRIFTMAVDNLCIGLKLTNKFYSDELHRINVEDTRASSIEVRRLFAMKNIPKDYRFPSVEDFLSKLSSVRTKLEEAENAYKLRFAFAAGYTAPSAEEVRRECLKMFNCERVAVGEMELLEPSDVNYTAAVEIYHQKYLASHIWTYLRQESVTKAIQEYASWRIQSFREIGQAQGELLFKDLLATAGLPEVDVGGSWGIQGIGGDLKLKCILATAGLPEVPVFARSSSSQSWCFPEDPWPYCFGWQKRGRRNYAPRLPPQQPFQVLREGIADEDALARLDKRIARGDVPASLLCKMPEKNI